MDRRCEDNSLCAFLESVERDQTLITLTVTITAIGIALIVYTIYRMWKQKL